MSNGKNQSKHWHYSPGVLGLAAIIFVAGFAAVYALLYPVILSDILNMSDKPSLRQTAKDTLDPSSSTSRGHHASENVGVQEIPAPSASSKDVLALSDSAQANAATFYQVSATSTFSISDSPSPATAALDDLILQDQDTLREAVQDSLLIMDSTGRIFLIFISELLGLEDLTETDRDQAEVDVIDPPKDRGGDGKPNRVVYDNDYFMDRPLAKTKVVGIEIKDLDDSIPLRLESGQDVKISITARNYQNTLQGIIAFVQITDENNIGIAIVTVSTSINDGESTTIESQWIAQHGTFFVKVFLSDLSTHPTVISEAVTKELMID